MSTQAEVRWSRDGQRFVHSADEPTRFVRELFRQYGESVEDLEVRRASQVVTVSGTILISVITTLIAGALLFSGLAVGSAGTWLTLIPVVLLGLLATLPIGAVLGSLFPSARGAGAR